MVMFDKLLHLLNAEFPIVVTLSGIVMLVNWAQLLNAIFGIVVISPSKVIMPFPSL